VLIILDRVKKELFGSLKQVVEQSQSEGHYIVSMKTAQERRKA
jgi:hypothetical protein